MATDQATTKTCTKCGHAFDLSGFYKDANGKGGRAAACKVCVNARNSLYARRNRSALRAYHARWYQKNRDSELEKAKRWAKANPDKAREIKRRYAKNNPEARRATVARWRARTRDARRAWSRRAYARDPERFILRAAKRRALLRALPGEGWTEANVAAIYKAQRGRCAYCRLRFGKKFERDHIHPVVKGGAHDRRNLQLCCTPCNRSKGARDPIDHARTLGLLL